MTDEVLDLWWVKTALMASLSGQTLLVKDPETTRSVVGGGGPHGGTDVTTPVMRHTWATQPLRESWGNHTHVTSKATRRSESAPLCA